MKKIIKKILKIVIILLLVIVVAAGGYVGYIFISYDRIGDIDLTVNKNSSISKINSNETLNITSYNVGFGATRMSTHPQSEWDSFCMHSLADAIVSGDYSKQEANINLHSSFPTRVETLKSIDWANIDYFYIGGTFGRIVN